MASTAQKVAEGRWRTANNSVISKVNPRGKVLFAVQMPGAKRPVWKDTMEQAEQAAELGADWWDV